MRYYHWTTLPGWDEIQKVGVQPYPVMRHHTDILQYCDILQIPRLGIYIWPEITQRLARDFAVWKFLNYGFDEGVMLEVLIQPQLLITARMSASDSAMQEVFGDDRHAGDRITLHHTFSSHGPLGTRDIHREPMDLYTCVIPPDCCKVIGRVSLTPERVCSALLCALEATPLAEEKTA